MTTNRWIVKYRIFRNVCLCLLRGPNPNGLGPPPVPWNQFRIPPCNNPELRSTACASVAFRRNPGNGEVLASGNVYPLSDQNLGNGEVPASRNVYPQPDAHYVEQDSESRVQFGIVVGFQFGFELVSVRILLPATLSKYSYLTVRVGGWILKIYIMLLFRDLMGKKLSDQH